MSEVLREKLITYSKSFKEPGKIKCSCKDILCRKVNLRIEEDFLFINFIDDKSYPLELHRIK